MYKQEGHKLTDDTLRHKKFTNNTLRHKTDSRHFAVWHQPPRCQLQHKISHRRLQECHLFHLPLRPLLMVIVQLMMNMNDLHNKFTDILQECRNCHHSCIKHSYLHSATHHRCCHRWQRFRNQFHLRSLLPMCQQRDYLHKHQFSIIHSHPFHQYPHGCIFLLSCRLCTSHCQRQLTLTVLEHLLTKKLNRHLMRMLQTKN